VRYKVTMRDSKSHCEIFGNEDFRKDLGIMLLLGYGYRFMARVPNRQLVVMGRVRVRS